MSGILMSAGAVSILWGSVWMMWDKYSSMPAWLAGGGLVALLIGARFS